MMIITELVFPWSESQDLGSARIVFEPNWNLVVGFNGGGKTTCMKALQRNVLEGLPTIQYEGDIEMDDFSSQFLFLDSRLSHFIKTFPKLAREYLMSSGNIESLTFAIGEYLNDIIAEKTTPGRNLKFDSNERFKFVLDGNLKYDVVNAGSGKSRFGAFTAMGEQMCLSLAAILAFRKLLNISAPLVWDDAFDGLDLAITQGIYRVLDKGPFQKILFLRESSWGVLRDLEDVFPTHKLYPPWLDKFPAPWRNEWNSIPSIYCVE